MNQGTFQIRWPDVLVFVLFVLAVVTIGLLKSRQEKDSTDYFLAGRGLHWWLIGFSLIAANISTEQFVGMSGNAADHVGIAIASYEWMAAITLVIIAFAFLPYFLRVGIYTMPEFLEYRFNAGARTLMAVATILVYILLVGSVTYSGALTIATLAEKANLTVQWKIGPLLVNTLQVGAFFIGLIALIYVTAGGLKACAWADLIQGSALVLGGFVIMYFAFDKLGDATQAAAFVSTKTGEVVVQHLAPDTGVLQRFLDLNRPRLTMFLPATDSVLPWTALLLGLWIPNFYYWGLNQYITQRTLGSASLAQGQRGIVFAAFLKLIIPFVIVIPGIIAFNLFSSQMRLDARADLAKALTLYNKVNPQTQFVTVQTNPPPQVLKTWQPGKYLIVILPDEKAMKTFSIDSPYVLPILKSQYDSLNVPQDTILLFEYKDMAFPHLNPDLAEEIEAYNTAAKARAEKEHIKTVSQALIAHKYDTALGQLLGHVLPQGIGLVGFVLAALLGAVVSSLAAMLNAASTIFAVDIYKKYLAPHATEKSVVTVGRTAVVVFAILAVFIAPLLGNPNISNSIFTIIQASQGFLSPGVLAVFVFGLAVRRAPRSCGVIGLLTNVLVYGGLSGLYWLLTSRLGLHLSGATQFLLGNFLNRMAISFVICLTVLTIVTIRNPLPQPFVFERRTSIALESSRGALKAGIIVILLTLLLYIIFSPLVLAK